MRGFKSRTVKTFTAAMVVISGAYAPPTKTISRLVIDSCAHTLGCTASSGQSNGH